MTETNVIKESWVDEDLERTQRKFNNKNNLLWTTEITGPCLRSAFYDRKYGKKPSTESLRVFNAGRVLESWWIDLLERRKDIEIIRENMPCRHINSFYRIYGRADVVLQRDYGQLEVHEIKTIKCFGSFLEEPKPEHVNQLQFYLNTLGIEVGYIDYINKQTFINGYNTIDKKFKIKRDKRTHKKLLKRAHALFGALIVDIPPVREPCWKCQGYCLYQDECTKEARKDKS
ncbi:MAG: CRISPR-associated protein Cas4 [Candidatus Bathyarchaeota archaeon]|nr:CRISPR-associated protein Cas4 [Candidatus Bathyarchaeota archaeon]